MGKQKQAYAYAVVAVLLWATAASAFKISLRYLDFLQLVFYSSGVSLIVLFTIAAVQKKLTLVRKYSRQDYLKSAILALLNPFLYYIVLFKAYSLLRAQEAQPLNYTWPIVLVLLSIPILRQKIGLKSIAAIAVSFIGVITISTEGHILELRFTNPAGVLLALGSSVVWALFWLFNVRDKRDDVVKLLLNFSFGFVFVLIVVLIVSRPHLPEPHGLWGAAYVGLFEMGITFAVWLKALRLSRTTAQVSNLIYLSPFVSLVLIHLAVGERILVSTVVGLVLIVGGIVLQQYGRHTRLSNGKCLSSKERS